MSAVERQASITSSVGIPVRRAGYTVQRNATGAREEEVGDCV